MNQPPTVPIRRDLLHAAGFAAVTLLLLLIVWPWIDVPFNDDWSFAFTVKRLLESGHLVYNHWSALPIISQSYWGALWAKLFGFSFTVLRWSTLPLALGSVALTFLLSRRAGLRPAYAGFVAMLLGTSPLFLPYAACFMTDVPGLFFTLAALYCFVLAAGERQTDPASAAWLIGGAAMAIVGGISRQSVFLVPLMVLPYIIWLKRSRNRVAFVAAGNWALVLATMLFTLHWFARQPNSLADLPLRDDLLSAWNDPLTPLQACLGIGLTIVLLTLPALLPGRWVRTQADAQVPRPPGIQGAGLVLAACVVLAGLCLCYTTGPDALAPWMDNTITPTGVLATSEMYGWRPISLPVNLRMVITGFVLVVGVIDSRLLAGAIVQPRRSAAAAARWFLRPTNPLLPAYCLFAVVYLAALVPRCTRHMVFDRYLLPVLPVVAIAACLRQQRAGRTAPSIGAWALLGIFALFALASLQELTALNRVRVASRNMALGWGIAPQQIEMGFEFDYWTQLLVSGSIHDVSLGRVTVMPHCTPDIKPIIRLEYPSPPLTRRIREVHYTSWLPPFERTVYLDWVLQPKLLQPPPPAAATQPRR